MLHRGSAGEGIVFRRLWLWWGGCIECVGVASQLSRRHRNGSHRELGRGPCCCDNCGVVVVVVVITVEVLVGLVGVLVIVITVGSLSLSLSLSLWKSSWGCCRCRCRCGSYRGVVVVVTTMSTAGRASQRHDAHRWPRGHLLERKLKCPKDVQFFDSFVVGGCADPGS